MIKYISFFFISFLLLGCTSYSDVEVKSIERIGGFKLTAKKLEIDLKVRVNNPNNYTIKVKDTDIRFYINDRELGTANFGHTVALQPSLETDYTVSLIGNFTQNINDILSELGPQLLFGKPRLKIKGTLKASAKGISKTVAFEHSEDFSILQ